MDGDLTEDSIETTLGLTEDSGTLMISALTEDSGISMTLGSEETSIGTTSGLAIDGKLK